MKTVKYKGQSFDAPNWAKFIVADANGAVWAYSAMPVRMSWNNWTKSQACDRMAGIGNLEGLKPFKVKEIK